MKEDDFDDVMNVNLKGAFNTIRHTFSTLQKKSRFHHKHIKLYPVCLNSRAGKLCKLQGRPYRFDEDRCQRAGSKRSNM